MRQFTRDEVNAVVMDFANDVAASTVHEMTFHANFLKDFSKRYPALGASFNNYCNQTALAEPREIAAARIDGFLTAANMIDRLLSLPE